MIKKMQYGQCQLFDVFEPASEGFHPSYGHYNEMSLNKEEQFLFMLGFKISNCQFLIP